MASGVRMSRSRGTLSGLLLVLLGAWGGLAPLIGPYFKFGFQPDVAWHYSMGRLLLSLVPGGVVLLTGLVVLITRSRWFGGLCAVLAALGGAWLIAGQAALLILTGTTYTDGAPVATSPKVILLTNLACFAGTGALIIFFAALAFGRQSVAAHKDFVKFGDQSAASAAGGLATVGLSQSTPGYDPYQATAYQPTEQQPEYQPAEYQPATYQATEYRPTAYPASPATETVGQPASGFSEPVTSSHPVVGGPAEFPSQYPDAYDQYGAQGPGPITYSAGQTQYPGAAEQTNPMTRPVTPEP